MAYFDVAILGAGASGLMAAIEAAKKGGRVLVVEHAPIAGKKILISGGGKCNVTNRSISYKDYFGQNPEFCKTALQKYRLESVLQLLQKAEIDIEEREQGRLFCRQSAKQLVHFLKESAEDLGVQFVFNAEIEKVEKGGQLFDIETSQGHFSAFQVVVATGGLSYPQAGATDIGHKIAKYFGHRIIPTKPALAGFVLPQNSRLKNLQGISLLVKASIIGKMEAEEPLLFTHNGLSGPAMLQLSCCWEKEDPLQINFLPSEDVLTLLNLPENGKLQVKTVLSRFLPDRLIQAVLPAELLSRKIAELGKKDRNEISRKIHTFEEKPLKTEGFMKAETTKGGVDTLQINPKTMESLLVPRLFFTGEVLDIAGRLGGYNIHWAFASGYLAGRSVISMEIR